MHELHPHLHPSQLDLLLIFTWQWLLYFWHLLGAAYDYVAVICRRLDILHLVLFCLWADASKALRAIKRHQIAKT